MRLAAIFNVWFDSIELLKGSLHCIKNHVDVIIIVYQDTSNFGEYYNVFPELEKATEDVDSIKIVYHHYIPDTKMGGAFNEKQKRQLGITMARGFDCTHFLHMDCDEYYTDFGKAKQQFIDSGAKGSVCKLWTYFKKPTLRFENHEGYFVPFIHELKPASSVGAKHYPFYVDPTRRISTPFLVYNETNIVEIEEKMHHFSYVRKDITIKLRNSSARDNIAKGAVLDYYNDPELGAGSYVKDFDMKLVEVENLFGIDI